MKARELLTQMDFLGLEPEELAGLVQRPVAWVDRMIEGTQPIPHWLDLLTMYWCEFPTALRMAREAEIAHKPGGPTLDDVLDGDRGIHRRV